MLNHAAAGLQQIKISQIDEGPFCYQRDLVVSELSDGRKRDQSLVAKSRGDGWLTVSATVTVREMSHWR